MKKSKFAILLVLCVWLNSFSQGQNNASFEITANTFRQFSFRTTIQKFDTICCGDFVKLFVDGTYTTTFDFGNPELPVLQKIIAIPQGATPELTFFVNQTEQFSLPKKLYPSQRHHFKNKGKDEFCINEKFYASNETYKNDLVKISPMGVYRNLKLYRIEVSPFEYNPVKNELLLHNDISVEVNFEGADESEVKQLLQQGSSFYNLSDFANKSVYENLLQSNAVAPLYVIVAQDTFRTTLQDFVQWKRQMGFDVELLIPNSNFTPDSIRNILKTKYINSNPLNPAPTFVTIVGDTNHIGTFEGKVYIQEIGMHNTDLYFGEYTDDFYPDALVGRISVADTAELRGVLQKIMNYEKYNLQDTNYLKRIIQVAGSEDRPPAPTTTNGAVNYLRDNYFAQDTTLDTINFYNPNSASQLAEIVSEVRQGASLLYYTAHGNKKGWLRPTFDTTIADTLGNIGKYFFAINNCCLTNAFSAEVCFGEKLLRLQNAGAIGVVGATNETLWDEDYYWAIGAKYPFSLAPQYDSTKLGAMDCLLHTHGEPKNQIVSTQAQILQAGAFAVAQSGSPYENYYWEIYNLLGDPSTMPYIGVPKKMNINLPDSLELGTSHISWHGTPFARVAIWQDTILQLSATFDENGLLNADFRQPLDSNNLLVTITAQFFQPQIDTIKIFTANTPKIVVKELNFQNLLPTENLVAGRTYTLDAKFFNAGGDTSQNAVLNIVSVDGKCSVLNSYTQIDTLLPHDELFKQSVATISVNHEVADGEMLEIKTLITENGDTTFVHTYSFIVENSDVKPCATEFWKRGTLVTLLQQDSVYTMKLPFKNCGSQNSDTLSVTLSVDTSVAEILSQNLFVMSPILPQYTDTANFLVKIKDTRKNKLQTEFCVSNTDTTLCYTDVYPLNRATETFETGNFLQFVWDTSCVNPWTLDTVSANVFEGQFSARSATMHDRQQSILKITLEVLADDTISFYARVSSERGADYLYFYIDDEKKSTLSGDVAWQKYTFPVSQGTHTFLWKYQKDDSRSERSDCAWIDNICFPICKLDTNYNPPETENIFKPSGNKQNPKLRIFPNPVENILTIESAENEDFEILFYTSLGQLVDKIALKPYETIYYKTTNLRFGTYTLVLKNKNNVSVEKIIVAK